MTNPPHVFGVSHHALLQFGQIRGFGILAGRLPAGRFRGVRAIHSCPQRSQRYPGTFKVTSATLHTSGQNII